MSMATIDAPEQREIRTTYSSEDQQYLTFNLAEEYYGVDILKVQEIKGYTTVTRIPNTPDYLKGVLYLRGTIVPIVDLRMKFGMGTTDPTPSHGSGECPKSYYGMSMRYPMCWI